MSGDVCRCGQWGGVLSVEVWSMWGGGKWGYVDTNTSAGVKGDNWTVYIGRGGHRQCIVHLGPQCLAL